MVLLIVTLLLVKEHTGNIYYQRKHCGTSVKPEVDLKFKNSTTVLYNYFTIFKYIIRRFIKNNKM